MLETVSFDVGGWWSGPLAHGQAAIRCWPPGLISIGGVFDPVRSLAEHIPQIVDKPSANAIVLSDDGSCVSIADTIDRAIVAVEVAEHAALMESRRRP